MMPVYRRKGSLLNVGVHVMTGVVQLTFKSDVLTGLFHDAAQGTLYFGQQPCTHLLKLTSGDTCS